MVNALTNVVRSGRSRSPKRHAPIVSAPKEIGYNRFEMRRGGKIVDPTRELRGLSEPM